MGRFFPPAAAAALVAIAGGVSDAPQGSNSTSPAWLEDLRRQGFAFPIGRLPDSTLAGVEAAVAELLRAETNFSLWGKKALNQHFVYPEILAFGADPDVLRAVEAVLGPRIILVGSTIFAKLPKPKAAELLLAVDAAEPLGVVAAGGSMQHEHCQQIGAHQDRQHWGIVPSSEPVVSVWAAFDDSDVANGAMEFFPGSHVSYLPHEKYSDKCSHLQDGLSIPAPFLPESTVAAMRAGEYAIFDSRCAHRSGRNLSPRRRLGITMIYARADSVSFEGHGAGGAGAAPGGGGGPDDVPSGSGDWRVPSVLLRGSRDGLRVPALSVEELLQRRRPGGASSCPEGLGDEGAGACQGR